MHAVSQELAIQSISNLSAITVSVTVGIFREELSCDIPDLAGSAVKWERDQEASLMMLRGCMIMSGHGYPPENIEDSSTWDTGAVSEGCLGKYPKDA